MEVIHGKLYNIYPFNDSYKPIENISILNGVTTVDTSNGEICIVELNHTMDFTRTMTYYCYALTKFAIIISS